MEEANEAAPKDAVEQESLDDAVRRWEEGRAQRLKGLLHDARSVFRGMDGWAGIKSTDDWIAACDQAAEEYLSGRWLINQLGAERYLDPLQLAVLWTLRQRLIDDADLENVAELMIIDMAIVSYWNAFRVQGWIGNSALIIEREFFGRESPTAKLRERYGGGIEGFVVEDVVERIVEVLLPAFERCNRAVLRNLQALRSLRTPSAPTVAITTAGQVNVAAQQTNTATVLASAPAGTEQEAPAAAHAHRLRAVRDVPPACA